MQTFPASCHGRSESAFAGSCRFKALSALRTACGLVDINIRCKKIKKIQNIIDIGSGLSLKNASL